MPTRRALVVIVLTACALGACTAPTRPAARPIPADAPAIGATDPAGPVQIVVWSSRRLPARILRVARALPGIEAIGGRASGILDLRAAPGSTRQVPRRPAGAVVPISATAIPAHLLRAFPGFESESDVLARGGAIVPRSSAAYRGLEVGDRLRLGGAGRVRTVRVGAIVEDGRLFRSEVVVPTRIGSVLGLSGARSLVLAVEPEDAFAAEQTLERAIGDFPARIRSGTVASPGSGGSGLLSLLQLKQVFGEFWYRRLGGTALQIDPAWRRRNIVDARVPLLGVVRCNRKMIPMLRGALTEIVGSGLASEVRSYNGCFNPRMSTGNGDVISRHAFGAAIDINAASNGYGRTPTMHPEVVAIFERWGFTWGGRWRIPDGMHFEFSRSSSG